MGKFPTSLIAIVILLMASLTFGADATETRLAAYTVSTYECIGIYWKTAEAGECAVQFRQEGEERWREGLRLAYDPRDQEYRGSLVYLQPDTAYTIQLKTSSDSVTLPARTKSDHFPIGEITTLPGGVSAERLSITQSGTPEAYHLITPASGEKTTIDVMNTEENNVWIDADYVILRGLELKNAAVHGIAIARGRHDIVIEDCRVTFWGRMGGPISFGNAGSIDSAIYANRGAGNLTIQRNLLEYPRGASNDWDTGHPNGPQAISLINSSGGNVIRFNELRTTEDHGFNDGIGGGSNFSFEGSPNRDSDIYGNIIGNVWDDAIESEGANMNVRIWGNYIHHTYQHVALASTSKGPVYVFRNVFGVSRRTHRDPLGGSMIKVGERDEFGGGRRFVFHNTALQPNGAFSVFSGHINPNAYTRNNIFDCPGRLTSAQPVSIPSDYDYDLFTGSDRGIAQESHGLRGEPAFVSSEMLEFYSAAYTTRIQWGKISIPKGTGTIDITDPVVSVPNPVIDGGVRIPNFNDDYFGKGPDLGAFELGRPPLRFGRHARETVWAPWELP